MMSKHKTVCVISILSYVWVEGGSLTAYVKLATSVTGSRMLTVLLSPSVLGNSSGLWIFNIVFSMSAKL